MMNILVSLLLAVGALDFGVEVERNIHGTAATWSFANESSVRFTPTKSGYYVLEVRNTGWCSSGTWELLTRERVRRTGIWDIDDSDNGATTQRVFVHAGDKAELRKHCDPRRTQNRRAVSHTSVWGIHNNRVTELFSMRVPECPDVDFDA